MDLTNNKSFESKSDFDIIKFMDEKTSAYINAISILNRVVNSENGKTSYRVGNEEIVDLLANYGELLGWAMRLHDEAEWLFIKTQQDYKLWYAEKHTKAKTQLEETKSKGYKSSREDIESYVIANNSKEWLEKRDRLDKAEMKQKICRRIYHNIIDMQKVLDRLSVHIRDEMKEFSITKRTEYLILKSQDNQIEKIRRRSI